jgi:hypothetical protein
MDSKILGYIVFIIHYILLSFIPMYITLTSKNVLYLLISVFYWNLVLFSWYIFDICFITILENKLIYDKDAKTGRWSVWYIDVLENMTNKKFAKTVSSLVFASPMILTAIGLYNIYRIVL